MSVNYYWRTAEDEANGAEGMHIGKQVNGHVSMLRGHFGSEVQRPILSWQDWKDYLREQDGTVTAEHGLIWDAEEFIEHVESTPAIERGEQLRWMRSYRNPNRRTFREQVAPHGDWSDADGFSFHGGYFC